MMTDQRRRWNVLELLLLTHLVLYGAFFVIALTNFNYVWYSSQNNFIILLFWTPLLLIHTAVTYYQRGRGDISRLEREAYRDGYADAMRQLGGRNEPAERLALDDEGELVEMPVKYKRHERQ